MNRSERSDLGYLGEEFQFKLVHTFLEDREFYKDLHNIIDQNMFTNPHLKTIVGVLKEYYENEDVVPSYSMMAITLNNKSKNNIDREIYAEVLDKIRLTSSDGVDVIRKLSEKFFKQQNIIKTANEILKIAGNGDISKYEKCVDLLNDALNQGAKEELGSTVFESLADTLSDDYRLPIPTGIGKIDETLEGGLGKGELGVIVGPTSFGKTSLTTSIASHASTCKTEYNNHSGFKVLQIVFEDRIKQIQRKHIGKITGIEAKDLSKPNFIQQVKEQLAIYPDKQLLTDNLRIVRFPSGEITVSYLRRYIKKLINSGFKPDLTIVDYFECLSHDDSGNVTNDFEKEGKTMRKLEALAADFDMAVWVPSQGTKDSINAELVTMDKMGGSSKKSQIAHIIMSIARTVDDIESNKATIAILKNRAGKSGKVFNNVEFNNGTCRISTDNVDEFDNMIDYNKNQQKELVSLQNEVFRMAQNKKNNNT